jgi:hypothetical protein
VPYYFDRTPPLAQGEAALAAGQAGAQRENVVRSLDANQRRQMQGASIAAQMDQQALALATAAQQRGYDRQFTAERDAVGYQQQQLRDQAEQQAYADREAAQQQGVRDNIEYELSAKQKQRVAVLNEVMETINAEERREGITPEAAAHQRYYAQMELAGIKPNKIKEPPLDLKKWYAESTMEMDDQTRLVAHPNGTIEQWMPPKSNTAIEKQKIDDAKAKDDEDRAEKKKQSLIDAIAKLQAGAGTNLDKIPNLSVEKAEEIARRLLGMEPVAKQGSQGPIQVKSDADYDAVPRGAEYIAPDGTVRTKAK